MNEEVKIKITFEDKEFLNVQNNIPEKNKITAENINEIKEVVNNIVENVTGNGAGVKTKVLYSIGKTFEAKNTGTTINLSDDITKYKRIVVYAMNNEGIMNSCEIYNPQINDAFSIFITGSGSRSGYYAFNGITRKFTISDKQSITYNEATTLTSHTASQSNLQGFVVDSKNLMIYAILGFEN